MTTPFLRLPGGGGGQPRLRLFCLPYAGGSEFIFRTWAGKLPPDVELCPVLLPGRGSRMGEEPYSQLQPMADSLATALLPYLDRPYAFFGHSMGALVSFAVTRELRRRGAPLPVHLFMSAHRAPQVARRRAPLHDLSDSDFLAHLQQNNGTPVEVLENRELMAMLMPLLRADFTLCDTYSYADEPALPCPITALGGLGDPQVFRADLEAWSSQTTGPFALRMFPGDHFFLRNAEFETLQVIARQLQGV
ncbi:MAG TPA: alpha/beta fold hydrolase [Symbiobacteriaceae bacterium]|nr:alpha/beta fold hydrolase [Symbiobacteriaceae bacterium]